MISWAKKRFQKWNAGIVLARNDMGFLHEPSRETCVAFIDILGFGSEVVHDFEQAKCTYNRLINSLNWHYWQGTKPKILVRMISDSIILESKWPEDVIRTAQGICFLALGECDWLVRGAIAKGQHQELVKGKNVFVVSEPIVYAVKAEATVRDPCIVIDTLLGDRLYGGLRHQVTIPNIQRSALFYEGRWIVNPFNPWWGVSAESRIDRLRAKYPEHVAKYDWLLKLLDAVRGEKQLVS